MNTIDILSLMKIICNTVVSFITFDISPSDPVGFCAIDSILVSFCRNSGHEPTIQIFDLLTVFSPSERVDFIYYSLWTGVDLVSPTQPVVVDFVSSTVSTSVDYVSIGSCWLGLCICIHRCRIWLSYSIRRCWLCLSYSNCWCFFFSIQRLDDTVKVCWFILILSSRMGTTLWLSAAFCRQARRRRRALSALLTCGRSIERCKATRPVPPTRSSSTLSTDSAFRRGQHLVGHRRLVGYNETRVWVEVDVDGQEVRFYLIRVVHIKDELRQTIVAGGHLCADVHEGAKLGAVHFLESFEVAVVERSITTGTVDGHSTHSPRVCDSVTYLDNAGQRVMYDI